MAQGAQLGRRTCRPTPEGAAALYGALRDSTRPALCAAPPDASHARGGAVLAALGSGTVLAGRGGARSTRPGQTTVCLAPAANSVVNVAVATLRPMREVARELGVTLG